MDWARRLKRVFGIWIDLCQRCGGRFRIIASIEQPEVIATILVHLERTAPDQYRSEWPLGARVPRSCGEARAREGFSGRARAAGSRIGLDVGPVRE